LENTLNEPVGVLSSRPVDTGIVAINRRVTEYTYTVCSSRTTTAAPMRTLGNRRTGGTLVRGAVVDGAGAVVVVTVTPVVSGATVESVVLSA
jgi:hypothetical protein